MTTLWSCQNCPYVSLRKWNLQRHYEIMHGQKINLPSSSRTVFKVNQKQSKEKGKEFDLGPWNPERWLEDPGEFFKMQNMIANSKQTFDLINNLKSQVNSLQQQIGVFQRQISDIQYYNWVLPKRSIQGFSGYICKKCSTFSVKPIFELGYDMTMQIRHRCNEMDSKKNYRDFQIPTNIQNVPVWAARVFADYLKSYTYSSRFLFSKDMTKAFKDFNQILPAEITNEILGIPDRYYLRSIESVNRTTWLDRALSNPGKEILLTEDELHDFLIKANSTYMIVEVPIREKLHRIFFGLTTF